MKRTEFVPYGETIDDCQARVEYVRALQRYAAERAAAATWPEPNEAPSHIRKARRTCCCRRGSIWCKESSLACTSSDVSGRAPTPSGLAFVSKNVVAIPTG